MSVGRSIYLDHSATTPTDPRVVDVMMPYFTEHYGNPSSVHRYGRLAEQAIEDARDTLAQILNCKSSEIVFTSGGSESDNLAIRGAAWTARQSDGSRHLVISPIEHEAVRVTVEQLATVMGFEREIISVDRYGSVLVDDYTQSMRDDTSVVSIVYANNEVGTIQSIAELSTIAHERNALFHTDAVQAAGQLTLDVQKLGVDMLSISAHKFYGPKGVGALFVRDGIELTPSQSGGGHENNRRAGTHNTPSIVGMATALQIAYDEFEYHTTHYRTMRDRLIDGVLSNVPGAHLTGHPEQRLPSHASFVLDGIDGNLLLTHLDLKGVAASSGSACKTGNPEPSEVLLAMGYSEETALGSLRLTVGRQTTAEDIDYVVDVLAETVKKLAKMKIV
ncbi:MAG: cysteine desulfurase [Chloroflexi bacterium]|nr:MAG: cysteine desulfurase [Chloroflexota bacterium]